METQRYKRIAIDSSIINWNIRHCHESTTQESAEKIRECQAIEKLFILQEHGRVILVVPDQVDREIKETLDYTTRTRLESTIKLCKRYPLTRFETLTRPRGGGINLADGAYFMTKDGEHKINKYVSIGANLEQKRDLEVLASVAIAGISVFVAYDTPLITKWQHIRDFVKQEDDIDIYLPSEIVNKLDSVLS